MHFNFPYENKALKVNVRNIRIYFMGGYSKIPRKVEKEQLYNYNRMSKMY